MHGVRKIDPSLWLLVSLTAFGCSNGGDGGSNAAGRGGASAAGGASSGGTSAGGSSAGGSTTLGGSTNTSSGGASTQGGSGGASGGASTQGGSAGAGGGSSGLGGSAGAGASGGAAGAAGAQTGGAGGAASGGAAGQGSGSARVYVSGNGGNIGLYTLDTLTGTMTSKGTTSGGQTPSYLAIAPDGKYLYAVNELAQSRVIAYSINAATGALTEINRADTGGNGACHLAVHPSGKWVVAAHYNSGHITVMPVLDGGGVGAVSVTSRGPNDGCRNAHQAVFDASGNHLFVPCLGSNYVIQFKFAQGNLELNDPATVVVSGGPRHMAFHPSESMAYVLSELESTITSLSYAAAQGVLSSPISIPSMQQTKGSSAHIVAHPAGKFLYASNRTENSIGLFALDATTRRPSPVTFETAQINTPRDFVIDPSGQLLLAANQNGNQDVAVYRIAAADGKLTRVGSTAVGGNPQFVGVLLAP